MERRNSVLRILLLFVVLSAACSPAPPESETGTTAAQFDVETLQSAAGLDYRVYVALPADYSSNTEKTYPVVYLLDGNFLTELTSEISRYLLWARKLPELIIVGIGYPTEDLGEIFDLRQRDLTPTKSEEPSGEAGEFLKFIQEDLIPHIDGNYRTDPMDRTLAGWSYGGLFSLYALFHAPETFNRYVALSPSLSWDDQVIFEYEEEFATKHSDLPVKLFLSVGGLEEERDPAEQGITLLRKLHTSLGNRSYAGLDMEMAIMEDETHSSVVPGAFSRGLRMVFR